MNFEAAASETFQILRSYDYEVVLFNEEHNQVFEPSEARRFFAKPVNLLVSLVDDGEDSATRLYLSKSIRISEVIGLVSALRSMATKYKMVFNVREYNKVLSPKDFATQASVKESKGNDTMNLVEGMYGTSRSSYLKLENARMIVRHSTRINENILGARGRNVETIHIEDAQGQRYLMPTQQLAPARAMAHHVDNGGTWADSVGEQIARMANNFADLGAASRHVGHYAPELSESALAIRETVREAARNLRKTFEAFGRKTRYAEVCEQVTKIAETLNEDAAYGEKVTELAAMLNTESVELSERVLTTVARVIESAEQVAEAAEPTVTVLHHPINATAWNNLKRGHIDLTHPVEHVNGKAMIITFREIIAATKDHSLVNFLSYVDRQLRLPIEKRASGSLSNVVAMAVKAATMRQSEDEPARTPAVREFLEWAGKHSIRNLSETDRLPMPAQHDGSGDRLLAQASRDFDYNEFMAFAQSFHHDHLDQLSDEERTFTVTEVTDAIDAYLQAKVEDVGHGMDTSHTAKALAPQVIEYMNADGYHITNAVEEDGCLADRDIMGLSADTMEEEAVDENCGACDGDDEDLTQEDLLLPTKQGDDLTDEVTKDTVDGPEGEQEPDDQYINRLQSLAGVRGRGF